MTNLSRFRFLWRNLFRTRRVDADLRAELEAFSAERPQGARLEMLQEEVRSARAGAGIEGWGRDLRYAARMLRKAPGFTAVAVLTLALGIGANTAIFSVVDAILLKPLPYPGANRLALVLASIGDAHRAPSSGYEFDQIRRRTRAFEQVGGIWVTNGAVSTGRAPQPVAVKLAEVTSDFLSLLCPRPALGRLFRPLDTAPNAATAVVISNGLWRREFGGDPNVVGQALHAGSASLTIVGVLPSQFRLIFPDDQSLAEPDVFLLLKGQDFARPGGPEFLRLLGRVRRGATMAQAQSDADAIASGLRASLPGYTPKNYRLHVLPLQQDDVRNVRSALIILFGGVGLVLLIACANVASLLLARSGGREREVMVRATLGASRWRIVRQLMVENLLLALLGGGVALGFGWAALQGLLALRPDSLTRLGAIQLDATAFGFTFAVALLAGIVFGLAPALAATRLDLASGIKGAGGGRAAAMGTKRALILGEVALSFALLAGTGLLVRTFIGVLRVNPGFQPANVLSFSTLGGDYHFLLQLRQKLAAMPGVESVSVVSHLPLDGYVGNWYDYYWPEGTPPYRQSTVMADYRSVMPGYFKTIGATVIEGRDFTDADDAAHQHVIIVDDALARQAWPGQDALGKKLHISDSPRGFYQFQDDWGVVVGVVRHVQYHSLTVMVRPQVYEPYPLAPRPVAFVLRASDATLLPGLEVPIRAAVAKLSPAVAVTRFLPLADLVAQARSQSRFVAFLATSLAALALLLTCIGIYGVTAYLARKRTREIAIRMALGAEPGDVRKLVLAHGMAPVALGCLAGVALALPLTPLLGTLLFGVRPLDAPTFAAAAVFLCGVGLTACYLPARRAMRVAPMEALRHE